MSYMTSNLLKQGHTWYVRYIVPTKYRKAIGKRAIVRTLKTRDLDEANRRKHAALAKIVESVEATLAGKAGSIQEALEARKLIQEASDRVTRETYEGLVDERAYEIEGAGHPAEAQRYAAIALGKGVPISEVSKLWLKSQEGNVTQGTIDGRRHAVKTFTDAMGDLLINKVTPKTATKWLDDYLIPSGRSPKTLGRYISAMDLLWRWAVRREYCGGMSPFDGLASELGKAKSRKRAFTDEELKGFLDGLARRRNRRPEEYDVGLLLIESGCRLNEIAELRVRDVREEGEVHIRDAKTNAGNRVIFFLSERAKEILKRRTAGKDPDDQLFEELEPGGQDKKLGHSLSKRMRATLAEVIPKAKEEGLDLHSIRRWAATVLENLEEIDMTLKDRMLGHSTGKLLTDVYSSGPEKRRLKSGFESFSKDVLARTP